jgi:hypothetical protein
MFFSTMFFKSKHRSRHATDTVSAMEREKKTLNSITVFIEESAFLYKHNIVAHELMRNGILVIFFIIFNNTVFFIS